MSDSLDGGQVDYWRALFDCVICERTVTDFNGRNGRERQLKPICLYCEGEYSDRAPDAGHFMDRRLARQLSALANALSGKAHSMEFNRRYYGRA